VVCRSHCSQAIERKERKLLSHSSEDLMALVITRFLRIVARAEGF
jgi:hypothetical protein